MNKQTNNTSLKSSERERIEGLYTAHRIMELALSPVIGKFDAAHLKEVNRRIFQDLPNKGFVEMTPGEYRPPAPEGSDWMKNRSLKSLDGISSVAYSPMNEASQSRLEKTLENIIPSNLRELPTPEFAKTISNLYAELDYIHPFSDGNSRTLRAFTGQLAEECGFKLDWSRFNINDASRDLLFIARDLSVNLLAQPHMRNDKALLKIIQSTLQLQENRNLPDLLRDAISPLRSIKMEQSAQSVVQNTQDKHSTVNAYLEQPHIKKMAQLVAFQSSVKNNPGHELLVQDYISGLKALYLQGQEVSPSQVDTYEKILSKNIEQER